MFGIEALGNVDMASHGKRGADGSAWTAAADGRWQEAWKHLDTFSDAISCSKVKLCAGDKYYGFGYMGRKSGCSAFESAK